MEKLIVEGAKIVILFFESNLFQEVDKYFFDRRATMDNILRREFLWSVGKWRNVTSDHHSLSSILYQQ